MRQVKVVGEPDAGKPHVRFEVAGGGNQGTGEVLRHSQRKRRETGLSCPKPQAPLPDPTSRRRCASSKIAAILTADFRSTAFPIYMAAQLSGRPVGRLQPQRERPKGMPV